MFKKIKLAFIGLLLSCNVLAASHGDYVLEKRNDVITVESEKYGRWNTWIGDSKPWPKEAVSQTLSFEFETDSYFKEGNIGHLFLMLSADAPHKYLNGRGVIIGNVSKYPASQGGCSPSGVKNAVVIETFWKTGNCVYGELSSSVPLVNDVRYKLTIVVEKTKVVEEGRITRYKLEQKVGSIFKEISFSSVYENKPVVNGYGGFTIGEVFSTHDWTFNIYNLEEKFE